MTTAADLDYRVPVHGSYINDMTWSCPAGQDMGIRTIASFLVDLPPEYPGASRIRDPNVMQIILGFLRRAYPNATEKTVWQYGNKDYTAVAYNHFPDEFLFVTLLDDWWRLIAVKRTTLNLQLGMRYVRLNQLVEDVVSGKTELPVF